MGEPLEKTMRLRTCVLKEILKTEKDYVETLRFLVQVSLSILPEKFTIIKGVVTTSGITGRGERVTPM